MAAYEIYDVGVPTPTSSGSFGNRYVPRYTCFEIRVATIDGNAGVVLYPRRNVFGTTQRARQASSSLKIGLCAGSTSGDNSHPASRRCFAPITQTMSVTGLAPIYSVAAGSFKKFALNKHPSGAGFKIARRVDC
jgi:hypothetical protein